MPNLRGADRRAGNLLTDARRIALSITRIPTEARKIVIGLGSTRERRTPDHTVSEALPADLYDLDRHALLFGVFGAAEHFARALVAGEGKDKVWLFVQHFRVASDTGLGVIFSAIGAGANQ